jgi:hypothetical protein
MHPIMFAKTAIRSGQMIDTTMMITETAARMVSIRGREAAIERCHRYISGKIKSEQGAAFWRDVLAAITTA